MTWELFAGVTCHICVYCGAPVELPGKGGNAHVCRHRQFFVGQGHRAHALCCADHVSGRDGVHGPCSTIHIKEPRP